MGFNDRVYGKEVRGDTTFIVTSGISGWAIPFKTGCISEYVIIDIYDR
jgi:predicted MPP superfamily phosphohydrolase